MWLFTTTGFYSIVKKHDENILQVRARSAVDLDNLRNKYMPELGETVLSTNTDYKCRAFISHSDFAKGLAKIGESIDYSNFKAKIGTIDKIRARIYAEVWAVMISLERQDKSR